LAIAQFPNVTGVSGMKKEELVEAIIAEEVRQGLRPKEERQTQATVKMGAAQLKTSIRALKGPGRQRSRPRTALGCWGRACRSNG